MSEHSRPQWALAGLGVAIIVLAVGFAFMKLLGSPQGGADLTQSLGDLVYVVIQVLFLAVMIWGGTILLDRGLRTPT